MFCPPIPPEMRFLFAPSLTVYPEDKDDPNVLLSGSSCRVERIEQQGRWLVVKYGRRVSEGERVTLEYARELGVPVPCVYDYPTPRAGCPSIWMDYIEGDRLEDAWPNMPTKQKEDIALQLKEILIRMRKYVSEDGEEWDIEPPEGVGIGVHGVVRDLRRYESKPGFHCEDEATFNEFLLAGLPKSTPSDKREQLASGLRSDHRICFTHADLSTRNIIVKDGKIQALLDWEYGGWYPEYWEYVKFLYSHDKHKDWKNYMHLIFPENYAEDYEHELTVYKELWRLQG